MGAACRYASVTSGHRFTMKLATRCPLCRSLFRVTPEELHVRSGKVRCGKCNAVFDGLAQLLPESQRRIAEESAAAESPVPDAAAGATVPDLAATDTIANQARAASIESVGPGWFEKLALAQPKFQITRRGAVIAGLLLLLLAGQFAFRNRAELVARNPSLRPMVETLCGVAGCALTLPHAAERISIDGDEMFAANPQRPNLVTLVANLKNTAPYAVAYPAIEITLQDAGERPVARRVLAPAEYLERGTNIANGLPGRGETPLRLALDTGALRAEGYRLQLFYPRPP